MYTHTHDRSAAVSLHVLRSRRRKRFRRALTNVDRENRQKVCVLSLASEAHLSESCTFSNVCFGSRGYFPFFVNDVCSNVKTFAFCELRCLHQADLPNARFRKSTLRRCTFEFNVKLSPCENN